MNQSNLSDSHQFQNRRFDLLIVPFSDEQKPGRMGAVSLKQWNKGQLKIPTILYIYENFFTLFVTLCEMST